MHPTYTYDEATVAIGEMKNHHEIWDGCLLMEPAAPRMGHQRIVFQLAQMLSQYVKRHQLGEVFISPLDMVLMPKLCLQPDIAFLRTENLNRAGRKITGPADWVAEITYPEGRRRDAVQKLARYERHGVQEYWLVDVEVRLVQVFGFLPGSRRYSLLGAYPEGRIARSEVVAGFRLRVADLFRGDDEFYD